MSASLGAILVARRCLAPEALERAERLQQDGHDRLDRILTRLGLVTERALAEALADHAGLPMVQTTDLPREAVLPGQLSPRFLRHHRLLPLGVEGDSLRLALADPLDTWPSQAVAFATGLTPAPMVATGGDIEAALDRLYRAEPAQAAATGGVAEADAERLADAASDAPVVRIVNALIAQAVEQRASDIHLEPTEDQLRVRLRVDGVLHEVEPPPAALRTAIVSRIKIMSKLDIAERRLAQDGRLRFAVRGKDVDFRVSTTPVIYGESVVLRILDRGSLVLEFDALGFDAEVMPEYLSVLHRPHGIMLVTGPTGAARPPHSILPWSRSIARSGRS